MQITAAATFWTFAVLPGGALGFSNLFSSNRKYLAINDISSNVGFSSNNISSRRNRPSQSVPSGWNKRVYNMILMAIPVLENWTITSKGEASGIVKNHPDPNIFDGELLTTSKLSTSKDMAKEGAIVITSSGSKYKLGRPRGSASAQKQQKQQQSSSIFSWGSFGLSSQSKEGVEEKSVAISSSSSFGNWGFSSRIPVLDNWSVTVRGEINGVVSNHPDKSISDGDTITTSKILEDRNALKEGSIVSTSTGSKYTLGKKRVGLMSPFFNGVGSPSAVSKGGTFRSGSNNVQQSYSSSSSSFASSSASSGGNSSASSSSSSSSSASTSFGNPFSGTFEMFGKSMSRATDDLTSNGSQQIANVLSSFSIKKTPNVASSTGASSAMSNSIKEEAARIANLRDLKLKYGINGKTVGDGKYLLCGKPQRSTSGKSNIWSAYRADKNGLPTGEKLTVKVSTNFDAISRESDNYNRVCSGLFPGRFVNKAEFLPETNGFPVGEFKSSCALVIESGRKDLKAILAERGGRGFEGRAMRDAASAALQCIQAMHSSGIVWTDLKTENFVIVSEEIGDNGYLPGVKGIDLESAMPRGSNPVDFSPEACPPEFANAFISGDGLRFKLDYSYDIWSYGMMLYELTTGRSYFGNKTPAQITKSLQYINSFEADVSLVNDSKLRDLIAQCLQADPKKRPNVTQLLLHPYFLTSGVGPFGW